MQILIFYFSKPIKIPQFFTDNGKIDVYILDFYVFNLKKETNVNYLS